MDINNILQILKMKMGIGGYLKITISDEMLKQYLIMETLTTYSNYFPHEMEFDNITLTPSSRTNKKNVFKLPRHCGEELKNLNVRVIGIKKIMTVPGGIYPQYGERFNSDVIPNSPLYMPSQGFGSDFEFACGAVSTMAYNTASAQFNAGMNRRFLTAKFREPDEIIFESDYNDVYNTPVSIILYTSHAPNLSTINYSYYNAFMELALLDLMHFIYVQELQYVNEIDVGYGKVNIGTLDKFIQADEARKTLLEKWDELYINDHSDMSQVM